MVLTSDGAAGSGVQLQKHHTIPPYLCSTPFELSFGLARPLVLCDNAFETARRQATCALDTYTHVFKSLSLPPEDIQLIELTDASLSGSWGNGGGWSRAWRQVAGVRAPEDKSASDLSRKSVNEVIMPLEPKAQSSPNHDNSC